MDLKFFDSDAQGPITIVTLSRRGLQRAATDAHFELNKVFDDFCADPEQMGRDRHGAGDKAFCAGNDLKWQAAGGKTRLDQRRFAGLTSRFDCDKPIIARGQWRRHGRRIPRSALACDPHHRLGECEVRRCRNRMSASARARRRLQRLPRRSG